MTVKDWMREIRKTQDAIDTLNRYASGEMRDISKPHIFEIRDRLERYILTIEEMRVIG